MAGGISEPLEKPTVEHLVLFQEGDVLRKAVVIGDNRPTDLQRHEPVVPTPNLLVEGKNEVISQRGSLQLRLEKVDANHRVAR